MIGALMDGASLRPKKKKVIFMVMPLNDKRRILSQSFFSIHKLFTAKGKSIIVAPKKRRNAKVKGGIFSKASLKIGEAAPQIMLAVIKASIALLC